MIRQTTPKTRRMRNFEKKTTEQKKRRDVQRRKYKRLTRMYERFKKLHSEYITDTESPNPTLSAKEADMAAVVADPRSPRLMRTD